jgi:hypothetical protein
MRRIASINRFGLVLGAVFSVLCASCPNSLGISMNTVAYDANGASSGSVPLDGARYEHGQSVTVLGNTGYLNKDGYSFSGWNTASDGSGTSYVGGSSFVIGNSGVRLYATWSAMLGASVTGAGLVSWGGYIYVIGGKDSSGTLRSEVWRATVGADGSLSSWTSEGALPTALAFASCSVVGCTSGNFLYVIGGRSGTALSSGAYFTCINSDGSLGFSDSTWMTNSNALPEGRANAATVLLKGRIVLLGGMLASGVTDTAIGARVWENGLLGQWYQANARLPAAAEGYAATSETSASGGVAATTAYLVGGGGGAMYSAPVSDSGLPGAWTSSASAPGGALDYPAFADTADGLCLVGGIDGSAYAETRVSAGGGAWTTKASIAAAGPDCVVLANTAFAVAMVKGTSAPLVASASISTKRAEAPLVLPGDGVIPKNAKPIVTASLPGDSLGYSGPTTSGLPANPASSGAFTAPTVSAAGTYAFQAFRSGSSPSPIVYVSYRVLSVDTFFLIKKTLVVSGASALTDYKLTEDYSNGTFSNVSSVWFKLILDERSKVSLLWAGSGSSAGSYTAPIQVTLLEDDNFTPALGSSENEIYESTSGSVNATLGAGSYFILVESTDESTGGSFGLGVGTGS